MERGTAVAEALHALTLREDLDRLPAHLLQLVARAATSLAMIHSRDQDLEELVVHAERVLDRARDWLSE